MNSLRDFQLFKDAYRSIARGRYRESIVILEKLTAGPGRDPYPLFLLAIACLFTDRYNRVDEIFGRIKLFDPHYLPYIQLQGFLNFKSAPDFESALGIYVDLANRYPADPVLAKSLTLIRETADFHGLQKNARLHRFVSIPKPPKHLKKSVIAGTAGVSAGSRRRRQMRAMPFFGTRWPWIALAGIAGVAAASVFFFSGTFRRLHITPGAGSLETVDRVSIAGSDFDLIKKISSDKVPEFYGNASELGDDFNRAKILIKSGRNNEALLLLNRIHNSNASFPVSEKAEFLIRFVLDLEERNFETVNVESLLKKPHLYRGYALTLNGKVANLREKNGRHFFSLLVDYRNGNFSGVADVYSDRIIPGLENGKIITLDSIYANSMGNNRMYLIAKKATVE